MSKAEPAPKPTVGRLVHYWPGEAAPSYVGPMAALVTAALEGRKTNLTIFRDGANPTFAKAVPWGEAPAGPKDSPRWTWPERV